MVDVYQENLDYGDEACDETRPSTGKDADDYESGEASASEVSDEQGSEDGELVSDSEPDAPADEAFILKDDPTIINEPINVDLLPSDSEEDEDSHVKFDNPWSRGLKAAKERMKRSKELKLSETNRKEKQMSLHAPVEDVSFIGSSIDIYMDQNEIKVDNCLWVDYYSQHMISHTPATWHRYTPYDLQEPALDQILKWRKITRRLNKTKKRANNRYSSDSSSDSGSDDASEVSLSPSLANEAGHLESVLASFLTFPADPKKNTLRHRMASHSQSEGSSSRSSSSRSSSSNASRNSVDNRRPIHARERPITQRESFPAQDKRAPFRRDAPYQPRYSPRQPYGGRSYQNQQNDYSYNDRYRPRGGSNAPRQDYEDRRRYPPPRRDYSNDQYSRRPYVRRSPSASPRSSPPRQKFSESYRDRGSRSASPPAAFNMSPPDMRRGAGKRQHSPSPGQPAKHSIRYRKSSSRSSSTSEEPVTKPHSSNEQEASPFERTNNDESTEDRLRALRQRLALVNDAIADITATTKH